MPDELAAFDEERKLARRQCDRAPVVAPQRCEAAPLESLLEDAQTSAIPNKNLAALASRVDEEKQIAGERIASQPLLHEAKEAVVAVAEIDCFWVRVNTYRTTRSENHPSSRMIATMSPTVTPSIRRPPGVMIASARRSA